MMIKKKNVFYFIAVLLYSYDFPTLSSWHRKKRNPLIRSNAIRIRLRALAFDLISNITALSVAVQASRLIRKSWIIARVTSRHNENANRMFNTCAASDSCILRDRARALISGRGEHAIEISPGNKTSWNPIECYSSNYCSSIFRAKNFSQPRSIKLRRDTRPRSIKLRRDSPMENPSSQ